MCLTQESTNVCLLLYHFETVTYSRSRQTLHATESSVSLVASLSSLTSLSSVSLGTSRALNTSNRGSTCHLSFTQKTSTVFQNYAYKC